MSLLKKLSAEAIATCFLIIAILGPGIMAENLNPKNGSFTLFAVAFAVLFTLFAMIIVFGPVSGAHLNPLVTLSALLRGDMKIADALAYIAAQVAGGVGGAFATHLMFNLDLLQTSTTERSGIGQWSGEFVATFGLFAVIESCRVNNYKHGGWAIAGYVYAACWFTSSTCFANPAVTIARTFTDTATGILPAHAPMFILFQTLGAGAAILLFRWYGAPKT